MKKLLKPLSKPSSLVTDTPSGEACDDAHLVSPAFAIECAESSKPEKRQQDCGKAWRMKYANVEADCFKQDETSSSSTFDDFPCYNSADFAWLSHSLLDSSEERQQWLQEQEESLKQSIKIDRVKKRKRDYL